MLYTQFIRPIFTLARFIPMVRTKSAFIAAYAPKTCSTRARTLDFSRVFEQLNQLYFGNALTREAGLTLLSTDGL